MKQDTWASLKDITLLALFFALFFGLFLGNRPLSVPDEGRYTEIPREMVASGDYITPRLNGVKYFEKPPLMYWLTSASIKSFGINEWALRFWPAFFAVLGVLATYLFGRRFYSREVGIASAVVLGTTMLYYAHSRILILDIAFSIFMTATLMAFLGALKAKTQKIKTFFLATFFSCAAGAVMTKGLLGLLLPGLIIFLWICLYKEWRGFKLAFTPWGIALFLVLVAPWHILVSLKNPEFFNFYVIHEQFLRFFTTVHKRTQPVWFFIPVLLVGLFPWVIFLWAALKKAASNLHNRTAEGALDGFLVLWAACMLTFFSLSQSKLIPYSVPILPALCLLIGREVAYTWKTRSKEAIKGLNWVLVPLILIFLIALPIALKKEGLWGHPGIAPYALGVEIILLVGSLSATLFYARHQVRAFLVTLGTTGALVMVTLNLPWNAIEGRSIKPLALELKKQVRPEDLVVSYHRYYQDLPPYSERTVFVVEYLGELEFGASQEPGHTPMIRESDFADLLKKPQTLYIVTRKSSVEDLEKRHALNNLHILAQTDKDVLLVKRKE